jgi:hypothetical protein
MLPKRPAIVIVVTLLLAFGLILAVYLLARGPLTMTERVIGKTETSVDLAALVTQIREMSRLETASMRVMHVATIQQSYGVIPNQLMGDKLTFLAVGDVIAGVDLSLIREQDVKYTGDGGIMIDLPPPMVLVTRVDNVESKVLDRDTGVLRRSDIHLESRARAQAEAAIRNEAVRKGILAQAEHSAEVKLADFLHTMGFQKVQFENRQSPAPKG